MSSAQRTPAVFAALFLFCTLLMRGPITAIGPIAQDVRSAFDISYEAYGLLTAIPIAVFGLFSFAGPWVAKRFGLIPSIGIAVSLVALGAGLRLTSSWPMLLAATVVLGVGIALMNVYMTVAVKGFWARELGTMMGIYTGVIGLSGAIGGLTAVPLSRAGGGVWATMLFWCAAALVGAVLWWASSGRAKRLYEAQQMQNKRLLAEASEAAGDSNARTRASLGAMAREPLAWAITGVMGLQSLLIYTVSAWMPPYWVSAGMDAAATGAWLSVYLVSGLPASLLTARFIDRCGGEFRAEAVIAAAYLAGLLLWVLGSQSAAALFVGSVLAGASQGSMLSVSFLLMSRKTRTSAEMLAVNALAQGAGYLFAGFGPLLFGALYASSGSWRPPFVFAAAMIVAWGAAGWLASRRNAF